MHYDHDEDLGITDEIVQEALHGILSSWWDTDNSALENAQFTTFQAAGIMTYNKGLVIHLPDGTEYQLTIVQSR